MGCGDTALVSDYEPPIIPQPPAAVNSKIAQK